MAPKSARNLLTSVDNLFTTQAERDEAQCERVITIPTEQISSFPGHPFHVHIDDKMWEMVDSLKQHGILVPTLVRPKPDGGYQMVAGHRRKLASELAGVPLPCIVRDLTDDEAIIISVALSQIGNVGGEPYWSWYGFSSRVEWCACFVSWCANECGYIDTGICPKFAA